MQIAKSLFYFFLAGLCEIGGGYLVWLWLRENRSAWVALAGAVVLVLYGVIPHCSRRILAASTPLTVAFSSSWPFSGDGRSTGPYPTGLISSAGLLRLWEFVSSCSGRGREEIALLL